MGILAVTYVSLFFSKPERTVIAEHWHSYCCIYECWARFLHVHFPTNFLLLCPTLNLNYSSMASLFFRLRKKLFYLILIIYYLFRWMSVTYYNFVRFWLPTERPMKMNQMYTQKYVGQGRAKKKNIFHLIKWVSFIELF